MGLSIKIYRNKKATTLENLKTNSSTIGNYYDSKLMLNRGKFAQYGSLSNWYDFKSEGRTEI